jgi:hypothetical protein
MRTKTLLLTAALSAAGIVSSMAQAGAVYSVNAVGYVNTDLVPGYNLISNPLTAPDMTIGTLFKDLPVFTQVFKFGANGFTTATKDEFSNDYEPASAKALTVAPGEGVFVSIPPGAAQKVTFVGEVPQGNLDNFIPKGLSIRSSQVPQEGTAAALGFPGEVGDQIYQFNPTTQQYKTFTFDEFALDWTPALEPLKVGEAIFVLKNADSHWVRNFSVNQ